MWFAVSLFLEGTCPQRSQSKVLWSEEIVLVDATSEEEARELGMDFGRRYEGGYTTVTGDSILWQLRGVERVCSIGEADLVNGTELFSRFLRDSEAKSLLTPFGEETL